jgi:flagellar hook-associated protein 1 FlgK
MANQTILQTTGNNIANVNTPGYSRQTAVLQTVSGQFSGSGYVGRGVDVTTITRAYSDFLIRQSALAGATSAGDSARADKLKQLEGIFPGGTSGLGAAVNDMLNAFSDVASAPTDLTARTVALTRVSEAASRMRSSSQRLDDLQAGVAQEISQKIDSINTLANNIARVNDRIARAQGSGQTPNDLLDQRDQLVRDLNQYVQTSSIMATDGTMGVFLGGSQALILGTSVATLTPVSDDFNDPLKTKVAMSRAGQSITLDENTLGGGEVSALLRFQNSDLVEGRNLLGRLTLAITTSMNDQHKLGLDLDGKVGGNLFTPTDISTVSNILVASTNTGAAGLTLSVNDVTTLAASDYELNFVTGNSGTISRKSDGNVTNFDFADTNPVTLDGLNITWDGNGASVGDHFLLKPFSTSASNISAEFSTPRALAVASPIAGKMGSSNTGSLQLSSLLARSNPPTDVPVIIRFTGPNSFIRSDEFPALDFNDPANSATFTTYPYTSGQAIEYTKTPQYPTASVPFSVTNPSTNLTPARLFPAAIDQLTVTNPALLTGNSYTIDNINFVPGVSTTASYALTEIETGVQTGPFTVVIDPNLPLSIPVTNIPGVSLNLTGDVRGRVNGVGVSDSFTITSTAYTKPVLTNWSLTLQGSPKPGDTFTLFDIKDSDHNNGVDYKLNAGNASGMLKLRDTAMFDGAALTDGYAGLIAQIGIRTQSANYSADVSSSIASNLESDRTGVSGVNLDEEASKLIQYQQAYQASAKMIQIAQSIFDTLIQTLSR